MKLTEGLTLISIRAEGTPTLFTIHHSVFTIHLTMRLSAGTETVPLRILTILPARAKIPRSIFPVARIHILQELIA